MLDKANLSVKAKNLNVDFKSMRGEISPISHDPNLKNDKIDWIKKNINYFDKSYIKTNKNKNGHNKKTKSQNNFSINELNDKRFKKSKKINSKTAIYKPNKNQIWSNNEIDPYFKVSPISTFAEHRSALSFQDIEQGESWSINGTEKEENLMESELDSLEFRRSSKRFKKIKNKIQGLSLIHI